MTMRTLACKEFCKDTLTFYKDTKRLSFNRVDCKKSNTQILNFVLVDLPLIFSEEGIVAEGFSAIVNVLYRTVTWDLSKNHVEKVVSFCKKYNINIIC